MEAFYMILPSNVASPQYFPNNSISNYTTKLPQRISLTGDWEVGLAEISYTYSWFNVPKSAPFHLMYLDIYGELKEVKGLLPKGQYSTVDNLVKELNKRIRDLIRDKELEFESPPKVEVLGHIAHIFCGKDKFTRGVFLYFGDELSGMLCFDSRKIRNKVLRYSIEAKDKPTFKIPEEVRVIDGNHVPDLLRGVHSLFLYCDAIKPTYIGDSYSQVLRVVEIPSNAMLGHQINLKYAVPYYIPLNCTDFEKIELHLKDSTGENIQFQYGRVIATLHFRRKN